MVHTLVRQHKGCTGGRPLPFSVGIEVVRGICEAFVFGIVLPAGAPITVRLELGRPILALAEHLTMLRVVV